MIDESADDLAAFGVDVEMPEAAPSHFEVWPENVEIVEIFVRCSTQWRVGSAGLIGLDYSVLFHVMEMYNVKDIKDTFEGIQVMEAATIAKINARAEQK